MTWCTTVLGLLLEREKSRRSHVCHSFSSGLCFRVGQNPTELNEFCLTSLPHYGMRNEFTVQSSFPDFSVV